MGRIVPDCMRALDRGVAIPVRNRVSTRPWQHVLEPLGGYLVLGSALATRTRFPEYASGFNFGPDLSSNRTVVDLVTEILKHRAGTWEDRSATNAVHEARLLSLDIAKAREVLCWRPRWSFETTVAKTVEWYVKAAEGKSIVETTRDQIAEYCSLSSQ